MVNIERKKLKQVLEAFNSMAGTLLELGEQTTFNEDQAIAAIREALAQPAQEPSFYLHPEGYLMTPDRARFLGFDLIELLAYYTAPPAAQPAPDCKETGVCVQTGLACFGQAAQPAPVPKENT